MRRGAGRLLLAGLLLASGGCELAEVTSAPGEDVLVVEAVLRTDRERQEVLLHRSIEGQVVRGVPDARVTVTAPDGREIEFRQETLAACAASRGSFGEVEVEASCYASPDGALQVVPGAAYDLRVATPDGRRLRGRTTVPGRFAFRSPPLDPGAGERAVCRLSPNTPLPLAWSRAAGARSYIANLEIFGLASAFRGTTINAPDPLELTGLAVSEADTTLVLPTDFGIFERADLDRDLLLALRDGFPAGVSVFLTLAAADRNYVNAVRGGAFNPSGAVRISSVSGDGVGVFGSLNPIELLVRVQPGPTECAVLAPGERF